MRKIWVASIATMAIGLVAMASAVAQERQLRVVAPFEITGLDPARSGYVFGRMAIAETLVTADEQGRPVPALAEKWDLSADRLTWRFALRRGMTFHDGSPVTAASVVASLERSRLGVGVLSRTPIQTIAADGDTVVIRTETPFASLPAFLANYTAIVLAPSSYDASGQVRAIIGTGPYRITNLTAPLKVEAERFPGWWGKSPAIGRVSYLAVGQGETRALMAESGEADLALGLLPVAIERMRRNPRVEVRVVTVPRTRLMKLNAGIAFFDDVRERRALSMAIDREGMSRVILRNPESTASQLFPPLLADWHVPALAPLKRDVAGAKRLLAEAGWLQGPDGILRQGERRFRVQLRTFPSWPELPVMATAMQDQLREVGIELDIAVGNSSEIPAGVKDGTLQIGLMSRNFSLVPDPLGTLIEDFSTANSDWGAMNWTSPELVGLLNRLGATFDEPEKRTIRDRIGAIIQDELPVIPIAWFELGVAINRRLANVVIDPFELSYRLAEMRWVE